MPAARYWRVVGVDTWGGGALSLSELRLYSSGGEVAATLGCTHAPSAGTLASLNDASLATACEVSREAYASAGFAFTFDCGASTSVSAFGFGTGSDAGRSRALAIGTLQYLDAGAWVTHATFGAFPWPGANAWSGNPSGGDEQWSLVAALLPMEDDFVAAKGGAWTVSGAVAIDSAPRFVGVPSARFNGGRMTSAYSADTDLASGDWTVEFWVQFSTLSTAVIYNHGVGTGYFSVQVWLNGSTFGLRGFSPGGAMVYNILGGTASAGVPYFVSARRAGSTITLHVDGVLIGSASVATALFGAAIGPTLGAYSDGVAPMNGWLGQVRITKGVAREAVVPSAPFPVGSGGGVVFLAPPVDTRPIAAHVAASAAVPAHATGALQGSVTARDVEFGGRGVVSGTVKRDADPVDLPMRRRVRLFDERSGLLVREAWSEAATGAYSFAGLDATRTYTVVAYDHEHHYRAVIADNMTPEAAP